MIIKRIFGVLILILFNSCSDYGDKRSDIVYLLNSDKSETITIFSDYSKQKRVIAIGKHKSIPKENTIILDISNISKLGDELGVCWNINNHKWELVNDKAIVLKNNLDSLKYVFKDKWYKNENNTPSPEYYWKQNCFTIGLLTHSKIKPTGNGHVERGKKSSNN